MTPEEVRAGRRASEDRRANALPTFVVIGAMKAGTTSLYHYLREHPQVFMPEMKEPDFFRPDGRTWRNGLAWYSALFEGATGAQAIGEASPGYTMYPHSSGVPELLHRFLPEARFVYVIRDPVARMISQYQMRIANGRERAPIAEALLSNPIYVDLSSYALQIDQYLEYFPRERLLVLRSEELRANRAQVMRRVFSFLGIDDTWEAPPFDIEFNTAESRRIRRSFDEALRRIPGYGQLSSHSPRWLRQLKYRVTTRPGPSVEALPERVVGELRDRLREDVARLRVHLGEGFDGWGIA